MAAQCWAWNILKSQLLGLSRKPPKSRDAKRLFVLTQPRVSIRKSLDSCSPLCHSETFWSVKGKKSWSWKSYFPGWGLTGCLVPALGFVEGWHSILAFCCCDRIPDWGRGDEGQWVYSGSSSGEGTVVGWVTGGCGSESISGSTCCHQEAESSETKNQSISPKPHQPAYSKDPTSQNSTQCPNRRAWGGDASQLNHNR